jgi:hypothetical protein
VVIFGKLSIGTPYPKTTPSAKWFILLLLSHDYNCTCVCVNKVLDISYLAYPATPMLQFFRFYVIIELIVRLEWIINTISERIVPSFFLDTHCLLRWWFPSYLVHLILLDKYYITLFTLVTFLSSSDKHPSDLSLSWYCHPWSLLQ